ncbi:unnamed protein product [Effrenium voratum]|uniref:Protein-S-isoprenylcysteine O-methyltransferase n=1 Tax=Effrenium voratum TaxID=2562239 RepID=A0AA36IXI4_9DINO|nr:unnamed protein product [Effrenium voratum]
MVEAESEHAIAPRVEPDPQGAPVSAESAQAAPHSLAEEQPQRLPAEEETAVEVVSAEVATHADAEPAEAASAEAELVEVSSAEAESVEAAGAEAELVEVSSVEAEPAEAASAEAELVKVPSSAAAEAELAEVSSVEAEPAEAAGAEAELVKVPSSAAAEAELAEVSSVGAEPAEAANAEAELVKVPSSAAAEAELAEVSSVEAEPAEAANAEAELVKVPSSTAAEAELAEASSIEAEPAEAASAEAEPAEATEAEVEPVERPASTEEAPAQAADAKTELEALSKTAQDTNDTERKSEARPEASSSPEGNQAEDNVKEPDDRGAPFVHSFQEFKEMGCHEAAQAVLRQGLQFCPSSAALRKLAASEGFHLEEIQASATTPFMEHLRRRELMMQQMHSAQQSQRMQQLQQWQARLQQPRYTPPPLLPEPRKLPPAPRPTGPLKFFDELEYPDKTKASRGVAAIALGALCGIATSLRASCSAYYFVWSFMACHLLCITLLRDYGGSFGLLVMCAALAFHAGHAFVECGAWAFALDGDDSLGPWTLVVVFACILYLQGYLKECVTLPPDYISTLSFFFPVFPAYDAAVLLSCLEFFGEWSYLPDFKLWSPIVLLGMVCMAVGQALVIWSARVADRNFWASTREMEEDELVGLEIPNRRVVQEGPYAWERHPAYLGALLWGVGTQLALCNPVMLVVVAFVLWASLLHVTMEEERDLFDEFPGRYEHYTAITSTWIPGFPAALESSAFQREMEDNAPEDGPDMEQEESEEEPDEEDDLLPSWEGVRKGGTIWNRQFQEPLRLG